MQKFIEKIVKNLMNNGFPQRRVALPTDKIYEDADNRGISFNNVKAELERQGVQVDVGADRIIFSSTPKMDNMMKQAQEMFSKMTPEQREEIVNRFKNMSPEEREKIMEQGRKMGII